MRTKAGWMAMAVGLLAAFLAYLPLATAVWHDSTTPGLAPTYIAQNPTDAGVYLAWIRQAADGHFLTRNLFAPGGPPNHTVYLLFWALGRVQALVHAPIGPFYSAATVLSGVALLAAAWWLTGRFFSDPRRRLAGFALLALSSGLGWAFVPAFGAGSDALPIDFTQPEAVTFSSLKTPLFALSQILMILIVGNLWAATRYRTWRPLLVAVPCAALLANSHTYDVISLGAAWAVWLAVGWIRSRRIDALQAGQTALVALAVAIPAGLNYAALRETGVLAQRDLAPTPAHTPWLVLLGFGLLLPLAGIGLRDRDVAPDLRRLLATWAVVPLLIQYLPASFQRKLVMGAHLPMALLAGLGLLALLHASRPALRWLAVGFAALLPLSNVTLTGEELKASLRPGGTSGRETLGRDERRAMDWLRSNAAPDTIVEPMPRFVWNARSDDWDLEASMLDRMTPGYTGHSVECGHWCETPGFQGRLDEWQEFASSETDDEDRRAILSRKGVGYLVLSDRDCPTSPDLVFGRWQVQPPDFLRLVPEASTSNVRVYRIALPSETTREADSSRKR